MTKTIVKHRESGAFMTVNGWSANEVEALPFETSLQALDYCCQRKIREAVLVLKFSDSRFDIELFPFDTDASKPNRRFSPAAE